MQRHDWIAIDIHVSRVSLANRNRALCNCTVAHAATSTQKFTQNLRAESKNVRRAKSLQSMDAKPSRTPQKEKRNEVRFSEFELTIHLICCRTLFAVYGVHYASAMCNGAKANDFTLENKMFARSLFFFYLFLATKTFTENCFAKWTI